MSNEALIAETRERSTFAEYEAAEDAQWWAARARVLADALEAAERDKREARAHAVLLFGIALAESDYTPEELPGIEHALDVLDAHVAEIREGRA